MPKQKKASNHAMLEEVRSAAQWWTDHIMCLSESKEDNKKRTQFREHLVRQLVAKYQGHWYPCEPLRGSAYRVILNDIVCDQVLLHAATVAGIDNIQKRLPQGVIMFVNPSIVKVQFGDEMCFQVVHGEECESAHYLHVRPSAIRVQDSSGSKPKSPKSPEDNFGYRATTDRYVSQNQLPCCASENTQPNTFSNHASERKGSKGSPKEHGSWQHRPMPGSKVPLQPILHCTNKGNNFTTIQPQNRVAA
jgi:protein Tob/BTG